MDQGHRHRRYQPPVLTPVRQSSPVNLLNSRPKRSGDNPSTEADDLHRGCAEWSSLVPRRISYSAKAYLASVGRQWMLPELTRQAQDIMAAVATPGVVPLPQIAKDDQRGLALLLLGQAATLYANLQANHLQQPPKFHERWYRLLRTLPRLEGGLEMLTPIGAWGRDDCCQLALRTLTQHVRLGNDIDTDSAFQAMELAQARPSIDWLNLLAALAERKPSRGIAAALLRVQIELTAQAAAAGVPLPNLHVLENALASVRSHNPRPTFLRNPVDSSPTRPCRPTIGWRSSDPRSAPLVLVAVARRQIPGRLLQILGAYLGGTPGLRTRDLYIGTQPPVLGLPEANAGTHVHGQTP
jgi:hypothetical protein